MNVFITGTSSGIGYGLAKYYLEKGANVYGLSRRINDQLLKYDSFYFLPCDLTSHEEVRDKVSGFLFKMKKLDLVVLNAGILATINDMKDTSLEHLKEVMEINVWANKTLIDVLVDTVSEIKQIVGISSGASVSGSRGWNAYALSKAALNMLMNLYAKELPNTHLSAFAPGVIATAMQDYVYALPDDDRFPIVDRLKEMKRSNQMPSEIEAAEAIAKGFLKVLTMPTGGYYDIREI